VPLDGVRWVVSTMPERTVNLALMHSLRERGYPGSIALTARSRRDAEILSREKPDLILKPFEDAAARAAEQLVKVIKPRDS